MTTGNLSGSELPQRGVGIIRRFKNKKKRKRDCQKQFKKLLWERSGNWDFWNEPSQIGSGWQKAFGILAMARKSNYFNTAKGQGGKRPGFFHYMNSKKKKK